MAFSKCGKYLAAGEGTTKGPEITIWDFSGQEPEVFANLKGHKLAIEALEFSPDSKYLISLGDKHDKGLFVWEMERKVKVTCNKLSKEVNSITFAPDSSFFVTAGN